MTMSSATNTTNAQTIWSLVIESIKEHIPINTFNTWFAEIQPIKIDEAGKTLIVAVPNELTRGWIQNNYQKVLTSELIKINPSIKNIKLTLTRRTNRKIVASAPTQKSIPLEMPTVDSKTNLNADFSFEKFIVSPYNRFAYTAAQAALERCGVLYNPLYFYGSTGVGKTHLLQAICNAAKQINPKLNVFYISSETFIEQYIDAVKQDKVAEFRKKFQEYQMIAIDDAQFFQKSEAVLVELFHLFNALVNKNAQIIVSSDVAPTEMQNIEDRIKTRLSSGLVIDIGDPQREDIITICTELAERKDINLSKGAIEYIADNMEHNVREIQGALSNIHLNTLEHGNSPITEEDVKSFVKNRVKVIPDVTPQEVKKVVSQHYQIKEDLLTTKIRRSEVVLARQISMYIFREYLNMSYAYIGRQFGGRDHTTVIHAYEKINTELNSDNQKIQKDLSLIKKMCNL